MKRSPLKTNPEKARAWQQRSRKPLAVRSGLKSGSTLKTRTTLKTSKPMRRVGKVGKANMEARKLIAKRAEALKLSTCELGPVLIQYGINVCLYNFAMAPAHRHKRAWYKGDAEKLAEVEQWVAACQCCHDAIEHNAQLTEEVFTKLRGPE